MAILEGKALVNIKKVEIVTHGDTPVTHEWETASEATLEPEVSEGAEDILRVKDRILATNNTEDIVIGYNITFMDNVFIPEIFALIDGGETVGEPGAVTGYDAPVAGLVANRVRFDLNIYTEEKDIDGDAKGYAKFTFKNCKGKPAKFNIKDGEFMVPELSMKSRPKSGEKPVAITFTDEI